MANQTTRNKLEILGVYIADRPTLCSRAPTNPEEEIPEQQIQICRNPANFVLSGHAFCGQHAIEYLNARVQSLHDTLATVPPTPNLITINDKPTCFLQHEKVLLRNLKKSKLRRRAIERYIQQF